MSDDKSINFPHSIVLNERSELTVSGVTDIASFDEQTIIADTVQGELTIRGEQLHIIKMSVDAGELVVEGEISVLSYSEDRKSHGGFFSRLLR